MRNIFAIVSLCLLTALCGEAQIIGQHRGFGVTTADPTSLLLHFDGTGTAITDSSSYAKTMTANGNATQSATQIKFGTASAFFDAISGTYVSTPNDPTLQFGGGAFTIDMWVYPTAFPGAGSYQMLWSKRGSNVNLSGLLLAIDHSGNLLAFAHSTGATWNLLSGVNMKAGFALNTWQHVAIVRNGNVWTGYINGIGGTPQTVAGALDDNGSGLAIGGDIDGTFWFSGYIDEYRVSKGVARWTSNFTPPVAPY